MAIRPDMAGAEAMGDAADSQETAADSVEAAVATREAEAVVAIVEAPDPWRRGAGIGSSPER